MSSSPLSPARLLPMAALVLLAACGDRPDAAPDRGASGTPRRGGVVVLAESSDMTTPMPLLIASGIEGDLQDVMFMTLLRSGWEEGRLVQRDAEESPMALARRVEYLDPDSAAVRFHLRRDARWSDGRPVSAHDVAWTYRALADSTLESPRRDYVEHLDSVVARDDSTVTFHFRRRYPEMLFHTGHGIAPRHLYERADLSALRSHPSILKPEEGLVVSGAFRIGRWDRGEQIVLVPNPHFRPAPLLERIVIRIVPDESTRLVELQTGAVDLMRVGAPANLEVLRARPEGIRLERIARRYGEVVIYNPRLEPLGEPAVRRALGMAIDVPTVMRSLRVDEIGEPAAGPYSPMLTRLRDPSLRPLPYDTAAAARILEEHGWRDADGDGVRERNGRPFRFTLVTNTESQRRGDLAVLIQSYWRRIGVDARLQRYEFQTMGQRLREGDFEAAIYGWQLPLAPDLSWQWAPGSPQNFASYRSPELEAYMERALAQPTPERSVPYWRAAARVLARDQPFTWVYYLDNVVAVRDRLRGTRIDTYGAYQNAWEWWVGDAPGAD